MGSEDMRNGKEHEQFNIKALDIKEKGGFSIIISHT